MSLVVFKYKAYLRASHTNNLSLCPERSSKEKNTNFSLRDKNSNYTFICRAFLYTHTTYTREIIRSDRAVNFSLQNAIKKRAIKKAPSALKDAEFVQNFRK